MAECTYKGRRLIVRRTRLTDPYQARLWPNWRHHAFLTDLDGQAAAVDAFHREHAVVELDIRDLKQGAGLEHVPSANFSANGAWLQCALMADNLIRWTVTLGQRAPVRERTATVRNRLIAVPARVVNGAGTLTLGGPAHWHWASWFGMRLTALRALQPQPG